MRVRSSTFWEKKLTLIFLKLGLSIGTRPSTATHPRHESPYSALVLTERTRQAVRKASRQGILCRWPTSNSEKLKLNFLRKNWTTVFPKLDLPVCTRPPTATHPQHTSLYSALVRTERSWQAVGESRQRGFFVQMAEVNFEKIGPAHRYTVFFPPSTHGRHFCTVRGCWKAHAARSKRLKSAGCVVQVAEVNFKKIEVQFSDQKNSVFSKSHLPTCNGDSIPIHSALHASTSPRNYRL